MYTKTAEYYDAIYHFKDYKSETNQLNQLIQTYNPGAKTLLDVACGTGKHLEYLKKYYHAAGIDLDTKLLDVARNRCPEVQFHEGDMTSFCLNATFDAAVCLFSSIAYVKSAEKLRKTISCMVDHLEPDGFIMIEPWIIPEKYWEGKITANFVDQPDLKIAWMYTSERDDLTSVFDIQYMVGTANGVEKFSEKHVLGLWTMDEYQQAFSDVGINVMYDSTGLCGRGMFFGIKK